VTPDFTYISLGAGRQSTALLVMSAKGLLGCPKADVAIFADTGDEPAYVYSHLAWLEKWSPIPIHRVSLGYALGAAIKEMADGKRTRFGTIPCFTVGNDGRPAMLRRQCTREYKIVPIERKVRELMGFKKGERIAGKKNALCLIGISLDEWMRAKPSRTPWVTSAHPLIDARMTLTDCVKFLQQHDIPIPKKSACVFCPFHDDTTWRDMKANWPVEFAHAVEIDRCVRNLTSAGVKRPAFIHRSLKPLEEVDFAPPVDPQMGLFIEECEGHCGV
jgi:hypothetical protein